MVKGTDKLYTDGIRKNPRLWKEVLDNMMHFCARKLYTFIDFGVLTTADPSHEKHCDDWGNTCLFWYTKGKHGEKGVNKSILPTGSEERGVLGFGSIPFAILSSCLYMNILHHNWLGKI